MPSNGKDGTASDPLLEEVVGVAEPPVTTRSTRSSKRRPSGSGGSVDIPETNSHKRAKYNNDSQEEVNRKPTAQEHLEDYVEFAANLLLPSPGSDDPSYHSLPIVSALQFLKSPKRRKTVWEDWSPYQISMFEAGIAYHGKDFYAISKELNGKKSTKEVVDFYYVWKKTSHYKKWVKTYLPQSMDFSSDEEEEEEEEDDEKASANGEASAKPEK